LLSQALAGKIDGIGDKGGRIVASAVLGGTVSEATGGKFANGAMTAAFGRAFNEEMAEHKASVDKLAVKTIRRFIGKSDRENREYGGLIIEHNGKLDVLVAPRGEVCSTAACDVNAYEVEVPNGAKVLATWHTHPRDGFQPTISEFDVRDTNHNNDISGAYVGSSLDKAVYYYARGTIPNEVLDNPKIIHTTANIIRASQVVGKL
jgi:hypothetical protein